MNMFKADQSNKDYHEAFWRHSLSTAFASRIIAKRFQGGKVFNPDPAFSAGLIHDIGKMVICCFMPNEHKQIRKQLEENPELTDYQAELALFGFNHAHIGRELTMKWKLPNRLCDAIGFHHNPVEPNESQDFAFLLSLADYVAHVATYSNNKAEPRLQPTKGVFDYFGIDDQDIVSLKSNLAEEYLKADTFMRIAGIS